MIINKDLRVNEQIRVKEVRLVGSEGEQIGVINIKDAINMALEKSLDLVEVAPNAKPPVCRIMDFGKYCYEQSKREREAKKKQKVITVKEVKLGLKIEEHDLSVKAKNALRFLEDGDKVKITLMFRGREITHPKLGEAVLNKMAEIIGDNAIVERQPKLEGKNMIMIVAPKN